MYGEELSHATIIARRIFIHKSMTVN